MKRSRLTTRKKKTNGFEWKHTETRVTTLFEAHFIRTDRADSSDRTHWVEYFQSESKARVLKHILTHVVPPVWHDDLDEEENLIGPQMDRLDDMTDREVEEFFKKCYGEYQSPDDDYHDKYHITVGEYEAPNFKIV